MLACVGAVFSIDGLKQCGSRNGTIRVSQHAALRSSLYPARRILRGVALIGSMFVTFLLAIGVPHYSFGVPVYDRDTGEPSSDGTIGLLLAVFAGVGLQLALLGRTIFRAIARHELARSQAGSGNMAD